MRQVKYYPDFRDKENQEHGICYVPCPGLTARKQWQLKLNHMVYCKVLALDLDALYHNIFYALRNKMLSTLCIHFTSLSNPSPR